MTSSEGAADGSGTEVVTVREPGTAVSTDEKNIVVNTITVSRASLYVSTYDFVRQCMKEVCWRVYEYGAVVFHSEVL